MIENQEKAVRKVGNIKIVAPCELSMEMFIRSVKGISCNSKFVAIAHDWGIVFEYCNNVETDRRIR